MRKLLIFFSPVFFISAVQADFSNLYTSVNAGASYFPSVGNNGQTVHGFSAPSLSLFMGAPVNQYFAPEVGASYNRAGSTGKIVVVGLDFKLMAPIQRDFLLFAKAGVGLGEISAYNGGNASKTNAVPMFGLGAGYRFLRVWMGTAEFNGAYFPNSNSCGHGIIGGFTLGITRFWDWW